MATIDNNTTVGTSVSSGLDPQTGLPVTGAGSATELGAANGVSLPTTVDNGSGPYVSTGQSTISTPADQPSVTSSADGNGSSTAKPALTESEQLALASGSATPPSNPSGYDGQVISTSGGAGAVASDSDWRIKLQLAPGAKYLYESPDVTSTDKNAPPHILYPLHVTKGIIFPYMPTIQVGYKASYDSQDLVHSNYKLHFYKNSSVDDVQITAEFTAQDTVEAKYMLAVIHFFKSVTKMFYGQDVGPRGGTPPPLCYLTGLGAYQFNNHPIVITNFAYNLPNDVDYIRTETNDAFSAGGISSIKKQQPKSNIFSKFLSDRRLGSSNLNKFAQPSQPNFSSITSAGTGITYVPTKLQIQITAHPIVTRKDISENFKLTGKDSYSSGKLTKGGIW